MGKNEKMDVQVWRNIVALYATSINLKETYNECQYYMSFEDLKTFYEASFFTKLKFCDQLHDHIRSTRSLDLFLPKVKSTYYITNITVCLMFKSNEIEFLLHKALTLEEKSSKILNILVATRDTAHYTPIAELITSQHRQQPERIRTLKKMLNKYY